MLLKKITAFTLISGILIAGSANAQQAERFLNMGTNKAGDAILLDTQDIEGTQFKLITQDANGILQVTFNAACGDSQLTMTKIETFSASGRPLEESESNKQETFDANSASGKGMIYVCRKIHARGW
ncbi:hypothetical protein NPM_30017 (plasmid) [Nostoc sp. 'Peltigera membranacea cyanobiont' N6]|nr:hypothetical protein NPM_30017 [Nostoc sp. 'Peltigera membranacea cyanobiont' N6]